MALNTHSPLEAADMYGYVFVFNSPLRAQLHVEVPPHAVDGLRPGLAQGVLDTDDLGELICPVPDIGVLDVLVHSHSTTVFRGCKASENNNRS